MLTKIIKNTFLKKTFKSLAQPIINSAVSTNIGEITPLCARRSNYDYERINILLPSINHEHFFGGIATAVSFFNNLSELKKIKKRIITTDAAPDKKSMGIFNNYEFAKAEADSKFDNEIVAFNDRYNKTIPVAKNDFFIATSWWTAFHVQKIINWQQKEYNQPVKKLVYLIQDFEPGFYSWSSRYALADSTYRFRYPQIAVFNSSMLYTFFKDNNYAFDREFIFEPVLNDKLKKGLDDRKNVTKKKQILIYGRPGVERNAFSLIIEALKLWVWKQPEVHQWSLLSVGEKHQNIELGNSMVLKSVGKLPLDRYVTVLNESAIGISLMVSPHPSYPPMEMALFGLGVISNSFANKELSSWHENITSIRLSDEMLASTLLEQCNCFIRNNDFFLKGRLFKSEYLKMDKQFDFMKDLIEELFNK